MSNKMLIDASHPEETRVAVVRGNRIEEYDFESQEKKQLRGNIYLAKVTRVEPSLQAAFVDYGGNRHGFLAFSEIHPDYYQIPVADRQALIEAEAAEARASRDAEDAEVINDDTDVEAISDEEVDEAPKKKPRRRRSRKSKSAEQATQADSESDAETDKPANEEPASEPEPAEATQEAEPAEEKPKRSTRRKKAPVAPKADAEAQNSEELKVAAPAEEKPEAEDKPKRRTTRRKKAPVNTASDEETAKSDASDEADKDDGTPTTMAAIVEMDSISEPLPEDADETSSDDETQDTSGEEPAKEAKPKRRYTRRKKAPVAENETEEEAKAETTDTEIAAAEEQSEETEATEPAPKKKRAPRRNSKKKKVEASEEDADADNNADSDVDLSDIENGIESVGQEDALEEVPNPRRQRRHYKIQEVIKRRQVLLVQVVKEERGNKGAALTTYLSLAGRYSVLMPNTARGGGISRKITNAADRKRLKAIANELEVPNGMGVILRTAGASRTNAEIERDFDYLMRLWEQVRSLTLSSTAPCLVYEEGSLIKRSIRDLYDKDTGEILVAGEAGFNEAKDFMNMLMPNATNKVKLFRNKQSIFAKYGVETQLDKMVTPQVTLKSGGYLIIDQTEALVAVDVNSGRSTREHSIENTALQTNLEAAEEVARQLRLRDLAGLIVIDFIDMEEKRNNRAVEKKLKDCLKNDRARIQVGRISHFGLMEMSRQRMRASVLESTMDVCSHCGGTGHVRSDSAIALHVFRAIDEHVSKHNRYDAVIKTTPAIALHILNHKRASLLELEDRYGLSITIEGTTDIKGQDFIIEKGELASGEPKSSAVGYQNGSMDEEVAVDTEENEDKGRKRGRGRRRKNHDDNNNASQAASEETENSAPTPGEDEEQPVKKRRRGKRGGKRHNNDETAQSENSTNDATSEDKSKSATVNEADASPAPKVEEPAEVTEEAKPKSRSTTRRKAPVSKPVESDNDKTETQEASEKSPSQPEPARPPRRTTRRVKPEETNSEEASPQSQNSEEGSGDTDNSTAETSEKKKKGWWNRGGGFF